METTKKTTDMKNYATGAVRDTGGKGRMDLLPMCALIRVSKHMEDALTHYPERNWEHGLPMHTMIDSALRHIAKYVDGMDDEDHLCAAATNLLMALWTEEKMPSMQDIPSRMGGSPATEEHVNPKDLTEEAVASMRQSMSEFLNSDRFCDCWNIAGGVTRCLGTKEMDECSCDGDKSRCHFYPEIRERYRGK